MCKTFNEFRYWSYCYSKKFAVEELPPTSASIKLHILRAFFVTYTQLHCFQVNVEKLDATSFGFVMEDELLLPQKVDVLLPLDEFVLNCTCKKCATKRCACLTANLPCCSFCTCKSANTCQNVCE